jgi:hexulose-6-phosphate isomerase
MTSRSIGIMQGRLVEPTAGRIQAFPGARWREEFSRASQADLAFIEWIYESHELGQNPLCTDAGVEAMRAATDVTKVQVHSVCADYFMEEPFLRASASELSVRTARLQWLIGRCTRAGISRIVLPFVDASEIRTELEESDLVAVLTAQEPVATAAGVELHLETSLPPARFARLMACLPETIRVNYDSGNSASLGYRPSEEFEAYGHRIGSVHIKDRVLGGGTVPLGSGAADLSSVLDLLHRYHYKGDLVLQVVRGPAGQEVEWARANRAFIEAGAR